MDDTEPAAPATEPGPGLAEGEFRAVLDAMFDQVAIGESIRDASGTIVDFRMVYLNEASLDGAGRNAEDLIGRTVLECFPGWDEQGQLEQFRQVVETGEPYLADRLAYNDTAPDGTPIVGHWSLSVVRFGDGYITASRDVTELVADEEARRAAEMEIERTRMAIDLLHRAALPDRLPDVPGLELAAHYAPAAGEQPVGGDWYDAFVLADGSVGVVIADVTGHGLDAAAYMVQVRNTVRALALVHEHPEIVLGHANHVLCNLDQHHLFATCCYAVVAPATGEVTWASAGHLAPLLAAGEPTHLATDVGPPLGVDPAARFPAATARLAPGDLLVFYTDGLVEDRSRPLRVGMEALAASADAARDRTMTEAVALLAATPAVRADDLALICVRRSDPVAG